MTSKNITVKNSTTLGIVENNPEGAGSSIGVDLEIYGSNFIANDIGVLDFDCVRVDERGEDLGAVFHGRFD